MGAENKNVRIDITLEAQAALKQINELNHELDQLGVELGYATKGTKEYDDISKRLVATQNKLSNATKANTSSTSANASSHKNSTNAINAEIQRLQALQRTLDVTSQEYAETTAAISKHANKMNQATKATGAGTSATMELSRIVSDAPYGIRGMANNISQFTSQMYYATDAAGSLGKAIKNIGKSLMGPLGIVFAITAAVAVLDWYSARTEKAEKATKSWRKEMSEATGSTKASSAELEQYGKSINEAAVGTNEYENALKELKSAGYDPLTQSVEDFIEVQQKLIILNATKEVFSKELKQLAEEKYILDQAVSDANKRYLDTVEEEKNGKRSSRSNGQTGDKFNRYIDVKNEELVSANLVVAAEENITEQTILRAGKMEQMNRSADRYKDIIQEILQLTSQSTDTGGSGSSKNKSNKAFKENNLNLEKEAQKHFNNMAEILIVEEDKQLAYIHYAQRLELDAKVDLFKKKENIAYDAYVKAQKQRIADNATNQFIVDDANRLLAEAKITHDGVIEESEVQHTNTMTKLKNLQEIEAIKLDDKLTENKEEHNRKMRDLDLELSAIIIEDGQVFQRYILDEQIKNQEADLQALDDKLNDVAYMESLSYEERLALKEKFNEESLALEEMNAARAMSIEEAKQSMTQATWDLATKGLMSASKLAEKDSKEQKTLALLSIAAGTAEGLVNGILLAQKTADASPPGAQPFIFGAMLATQTASVLGAAAQAKSILNGGSASSSGGSSSSATVESFSPNFNVVGNSNENQLAQSIGNQANSPVQAFVVYDDIAEAESVTQQSIESSGI